MTCPVPTPPLTAGLCVLLQPVVSELVNVLAGRNLFLNQPDDTRQTVDKIFLEYKTSQINNKLLHLAAF